MVPLFLAEAIVLIHFAFILFVMFGGLLVLKWRRLIWVHLLAVVWGVLVVAMGWICPLTPLENRLRSMAGQEGYSGDFISRYLLPLIYPAGLDVDLQVAIPAFVVMINGIIYVFYFRKRGRK